MSTAPLTPQSSRVKQARQLTRRASRVDRREFLADGPQSVREAFSVPDCVSELFATGPALDRHRDIAALAAELSVDVRICDDRAIGSLAGSVTPQGLVAVCRFVDIGLEEAVDARSRLVVIGAHVRDPGNAGSLLRCADAAGADAVVFAGSSVDPYNDKAVRSSVGSLFHLPVVIGTTVDAAVETVKRLGFQVLAAAARGEVTLDDMVDARGLIGRVAWIFGNEAWGIPEDEARLADRSVAVPIYGRAESLNVSSPAALCLYATARAQRDRRQGVGPVPGHTP